jgi:hypothetical protein
MIMFSSALQKARRIDLRALAEPLRLTSRLEMARAHRGRTLRDMRIMLDFAS